MALPTKEKTWEFDVNRWFQHSTTNEEVAARELNYNFKNMMLGTEFMGWQGAITEIVPGATYQIQITTVGYDPTRPGQNLLTDALIGRGIRITGASNGGNNGVFEITDVPATDTVQYACTTGVAEPGFAGSVHISSGKFTTGGGTPATETLTFTGNALNDETVTIASRVYTFKTTLDAATADTVLIGASASDSLDNLIAAINRDAGEGTLYGGLTRDNFEVIASAGAGDTMDVEAKARNARGNAVTVATSVTGASWIGSNLTGGVDGYFSSWVCKGSHGSGKGASMDGIDRYTVDTDVISNTSGTISWFVYRNEVTGAEMLHFEDCQFSSTQFIDKFIYVSPEGGFTGGTTTVRPTAPDEVNVHGNTTSWVGHELPAAQTWVLHMSQSDDGEDTRFHGNAWGNNYFSYICDTVKDAKKNGALIPWPGYRNVMDWTRTDGQVMTIANWSDNAQMRVTLDRDSVAGGPYTAACFVTAESYVSATLAENFLDVRDELAGEFLITPLGLACGDVGQRGRYGRISDWWWSNAQNAIIPNGATFPTDGSHQFVRVGHFIFPWNGEPKRIK